MRTVLLEFSKLPARGIASPFYTITEHDNVADFEPITGTYPGIHYALVRHRGVRKRESVIAVQNMIAAAYQEGEVPSGMRYPLPISTGYLSQQGLDTLSSAGYNPIRTIPGVGTFVWGLYLSHNAGPIYPAMLMGRAVQAVLMFLTQELGIETSMFCPGLVSRALSCTRYVLECLERDTRGHLELRVTEMPKDPDHLNTPEALMITLRERPWQKHQHGVFAHAGVIIPLCVDSECRFTKVILIEEQARIMCGLYPHLLSEESTLQGLREVDLYNPTIQGNPG